MSRAMRITDTLTPPRMRLFPLSILYAAWTISIQAWQLPQYMPPSMPMPQVRQPSQPCFCVTNNEHHPVVYPPQYTTFISSEQMLSRPEAVQLLDTHVLPMSEKGYRMNLNGNDIVDNNIDIDSSTYGEFSLTSLDVILDRIAQEFSQGNEDDVESTTTERRQGPLIIIDIGSGCGRLVLYMAIAQRCLQQYSNDLVVTGIEQSKALHEESIRATERLLQYNNAREHFKVDQDHPVECTNNEIRLYYGSANDFLNEIHAADIIICYSTAFSSGDFLPSISALLLSQEWNTILTPRLQQQQHPSAASTAPSLQSTLYCVTMDKALDPSRGWIMVDRINVPNPEIGVESIAFLQKFDRYYN